MKMTRLPSMLLMTGAFTPSLALAHAGHGDTPLHALMHLFEANGVWLGLVLIVGIGTLAWQVRRNHLARHAEIPRQESDHDSR